MIAIPQCIWCNFSYGKDYCRWIVYDNELPEEEKEYCRKIYDDAFGFKKLAFFNYHRDSSLDNIEFERDLDKDVIDQINILFKQQEFEDYTDHEKDWLRLKYAHHVPDCSLMFLDECPQEERELILEKLVFLNPHPKDDEGLPIPMFEDSDGNTKEWPRDKGGKPISVYELGDF